MLPVQTDTCCGCTITSPPFGTHEWTQAALCVFVQTLDVATMERLLAWPSAQVFKKKTQQEWDQVRVNSVCILCAMLARGLLCSSHLLAACR